MKKQKPLFEIFRTCLRENHSFINSISTVDIGSYPIIESTVAINLSRSILWFDVSVDGHKAKIFSVMY